MDNKQPNRDDTCSDSLCTSSPQSVSLTTSKAASDHASLLNEDIDNEQSSNIPESRFEKQTLEISKGPYIQKMNVPSLEAMNPQVELSRLRNDAAEYPVATSSSEMEPLAEYSATRNFESLDTESKSKKMIQTVQDPCQSEEASTTTSPKIQLEVKADCMDPKLSHLSANDAGKLTDLKSKECMKQSIPTYDDDIFCVSSSEDDEPPFATTLDSSCLTSFQNKMNDVKKLNQSSASDELIPSDCDSSVNALDLCDPVEIKVNNDNVITSSMSHEKKPTSNLSSEEEDAGSIPQTRTHRVRTKRGIVLSDAEMNEIYNTPITPSARIFSSCIERYHKEVSEINLKVQASSSNENENCAAENKLASDNSQAKEGYKCPIPKELAARFKAKKRQLKQEHKRKQKERDKEHEKFIASLNVTWTELTKEELESAVKTPEERTVTILVRYHKKISRFEMKGGDPFTKIFLWFAKTYNLDVGRLYLLLRDNFIYPDDTPVKVNYNIEDILDCDLYVPGAERNPWSWINLKVQSNDTKEKHVLAIHKLQPLSMLMEQYSKKRGIPLERMRFQFDGENIDPTLNSLDLTLENDNVIDVRIS